MKIKVGMISPESNIHSCSDTCELKECVEARATRAKRVPILQGLTRKPRPKNRLTKITLDKETKERFEKYVIPEPNTGCWIWVGHTVNKGYGSFSYKNILYTTHRFAWMMYVGEIKDKLWVLHKCNTTVCCNPSHLYLGNQIDNTRDAILAGHHCRQKVSLDQRKEIIDLGLSGVKLKKIADKYSILYATVVQIFNREKIAWNNKRKPINMFQKKEIFRLSKLKLSNRKIGSIVGTTHSTVKRILQSNEEST